MVMQFGPETLEGVLLFLQPALACVAQVVGSDAIDPSQQAAFTSKTSQMRNHTNQNLLRRIAGVFRVPEHTQCKAIDLILDLLHKLLECLAVAYLRLSRELFQRSIHLPSHCPLSIARSFASSARRMCDCASSAPSSCSSETGGASKMKE